MVAFKGNPDFLKEPRALQVAVYDKAVDKFGGRYADVQLDSRDPQAQGQSNLHLATRFPSKDAKVQKPNHDARYSESQMNAIKEAAGNNFIRDDQRGLTVYAVKAKLTSTKNNPGLIINTKEGVQASDFNMTQEARDAQFAAMRASKAQKDAAKQEAPQADAQASQPQAAAAQQAPESAVDEPEF